MKKSEMVPDARLCPCGSKLRLEACCLPVLTGEHPAATAEALMRSRYTAYALGKYDYLESSWHPSTRPESLHPGANIEWLGLEVLSVRSGLALDTRGTVEFVAHYRQQGSRGQVHESSRFVKERGEWFYLDGDLKAAATTGRNDPCPCGSGRKFKKCCGR